MPHGDFSDKAAFGFLAMSIAMMTNPELLNEDFGPIKAAFEGEMTPALNRAVSFAGGLLLFLTLTMYIVRWNTVNGKFAGGPAMFINAFNCCLISWRMDNAFVLRQWHIFALWFLFAGLHLTFNANPMWTSKTLAKKEAERAARKAAKKNKSK